MSKHENENTNDSYVLAKQIADLALSKKAEDVVLLDMKGISGFTDYFIICSGNGKLQVKAICDAVENGLYDHNIKALHREGYALKKWILLDYFDVVCHVFDQESRQYYQLEQLWGDAKKEVIEDSEPIPTH